MPIQLWLKRRNKFGLFVIPLSLSVEVDPRVAESVKKVKKLSS